MGIGFCFLIPAIFITISIFDFVAMWGDGPGPSPLIMLIAPAILFSVGGMMIIQGIRYYISWPQRMEKQKEIHITQIQDPTTDQDAYRLSSGYTPTPTINIPNHCSNCAAKLSYEELTWVGPMTFKCPSCGHEMLAERKGF